MKYTIEPAYIVLNKENEIVDWFTDEDDAVEFVAELEEAE